MVSTSRSSSSRRLTMASLGARLYLLTLWSTLLFGGMIITPAVSSPTADPPADHESILHALRFQGLTASADALDSVIWNSGFLVPASATLFVPMNSAMAPVAASLNATELIKLLSHHIVTENLPVGMLTKLPVGTKLTTMVGNNSLEVTENSKTVMTINHQEVMPEDLCTISTVACYAVKEVLMLESGAGEKKDTSFGVPVAAPEEAPMLSPAGLPLPPLGAPMMSPMGSPMGAPVPAAAPTAFPPPESPVSVPVPAGAPAVISLPTAGSPGSSPPGSPTGSPLSPGEAPGAAPEEAAGSAAMATTTASMATVVAAAMLTILVL